jgi:hypothetical protein
MENVGGNGFLLPGTKPRTLDPTQQRTYCSRKVQNMNYTYVDLDSMMQRPEVEFTNLIEMAITYRWVVSQEAI